MNWKYEELMAISQALDKALSAPRAEGKCQALIYGHRYDDGGNIMWRIRCLECGFTCEGYSADVVEPWNSHITYR